MSLAGLSLAVSDHVARLGPASIKPMEALTEHLGHAYWSRMIAETIMSLVDPAYTPKGRTLAICNQVKP